MLGILWRMELIRKKPLRGTVILLIATIAWGFSYVMQSKAMDYLEPLTYNGIRILVGGIALIPVVFLFRKLDPAYREMDPESTQRMNRITFCGGIVCGICLCGAASLQQYGISMSSAGKSGFITALYIVMVPIFGILFRRRVTWVAALGVLLAAIGFYFLSVKERFEIETGDFLLLAGAFLFSFQILFIDHFLEKGAEPVMMCCVEFLMAGIILIPVMFLTEHPVWQNIWDAKETILYAGLVSGAFGYCLQMIGQRDLEPTAASLLMSLESVFAALFGWLVLNEHLSLKELLGCALVFAAVILAQIPVKEKGMHS